MYIVIVSIIILLLIVTFIYYKNRNKIIKELKKIEKQDRILKNKRG